MVSTNGNVAYAHALRKAVATFTAGPESRVAVIPLHAGHHAMWSSQYHQADICNMANDWVFVDQETGLLYRFPITTNTARRDSALINAMIWHDNITKNPWLDENAKARYAMIHASVEHRDNRHILNIFDPGPVTPALDGYEGYPEPDRLIAAMIEENPGAIVAE